QKDRTFATLGNHEYDAGTADGTFDYFGEAQAGPRGKGYYSFDTGGWHIIVLNSNVSHVPASAGSEQDLWLQADLAAQAARPAPPFATPPAVHRPRFSPSTSSNSPPPPLY